MPEFDDDLEKALFSAQVPEKTVDAIREAYLEGTKDIAVLAQRFGYDSDTIQDIVLQRNQYADDLSDLKTGRKQASAEIGAEGQTQWPPSKGVILAAAVRAAYIPGQFGYKALAARFALDRGTVHQILTGKRNRSGHISEEQLPELIASVDAAFYRKHFGKINRPIAGWELGHLIDRMEQRYGLQLTPAHAKKIADLIKTQRMGIVQQWEAGAIHALSSPRYPFGPIFVFEPKLFGGVMSAYPSDRFFLCNGDWLTRRRLIRKKGAEENAKVTGYARFIAQKEIGGAAREFDFSIMELRPARSDNTITAGQPSNIELSPE